jgi:hypothetical protein
MSESKPGPRLHTKLTIKPLPMVPRRKASDSPIPMEERSLSQRLVSLEPVIIVQHDPIVNNTGSIDKIPIITAKMVENRESISTIVKLQDPSISIKPTRIMDSEDKDIPLLNHSNPPSKPSSQRNSESEIQIGGTDTTDTFTIIDKPVPDGKSEEEFIGNLDISVLGGFKPRQRRNVVQPTLNGDNMNSNYFNVPDNVFEEIQLTKDANIKSGKKKDSMSNVQYLDDYISHVKEVPRRQKRPEQCDLLQDLILSSKENTPNLVYKLISLEDFRKSKYYKKPKK